MVFLEALMSGFSLGYLRTLWPRKSHLLQMHDDRLREKKFRFSCLQKGFDEGVDFPFQ